MDGQDGRGIAADAEESGLGEGELSADTAQDHQADQRDRPYDGLREPEDDEIREAE